MCVRIKCAADESKFARALQIRIFNEKYGKNGKQNVPQKKKKRTIPITNDRISNSLTDLLGTKID